MTAEQDWWPSPAKLNLFLHITGRRQDGYHELQSLFQLLDKGDALAFDTHQAEISLTQQIPGVPEQKNLIWKAAHALNQYTSSDRGVHISLKKQLPMGGGIGGGSSNAATTLVALNHLWQLGLKTAELMEIGLTLGADVPIFVKGLTAFAEGVGEQITPAPQQEAWYLVATPAVQVSTAEIFACDTLPRNTAKIVPGDYQFETTHNDCQPTVCNNYPKVAKLLQWLIEYAPSRMTGTGASVFAVFHHQNQAEFVLKHLPYGVTGFVAKGVDRSPLLDKLTLVQRARERK